MLRLMGVGLLAGRLHESMFRHVLLAEK